MKVISNLENISVFTLILIFNMLHAIVDLAGIQNTSYYVVVAPAYNNCGILRNWMP
jgi:hypothetical protein